MKKLLLLTVCGLVLSGFHYVQAEETTTSDVTETTIMKTDKDPFSEDSYKTVYKTDVYKIGTDMPAGEYKIYAQAKYASAKLTGDARGENNISYQSVKTFSYMKVEDGQYLELSDCFAVPVEETWPVQPENDTLGEGVYKVGYDIEPGEYKATAFEEYATYEINKDANANDYVDYGSIKKSSYIEVKKGEYLVLEGAELSLK